MNVHPLIGYSYENYDPFINFGVFFKANNFNFFDVGYDGFNFLFLTSSQLYSLNQGWFLISSAPLNDPNL